MALKTNTPMAFLAIALMFNMAASQNYKAFGTRPSAALPATTTPTAPTDPTRTVVAPSTTTTTATPTPAATTTVSPTNATTTTSTPTPAVSTTTPVVATQGSTPTLNVAVIGNHVACQVKYADKNNQEFVCGSNGKLYDSLNVMKCMSSDIQSIFSCPKSDLKCYNRCVNAATRDTTCKSTSKTSRPFCADDGNIYSDASQMQCVSSSNKFVTPCPSSITPEVCQTYCVAHSKTARTH